MFNFQPGWAVAAIPLAFPVKSASMRINDGDNALGNNAGSLRVCFGR
jgi:hypothetical protein